MAFTPQKPGRPGFLLVSRLFQWRLGAVYAIIEELSRASHQGLIGGKGRADNLLPIL